MKPQESEISSNSKTELTPRSSSSVSPVEFQQAHHSVVVTANESWPKPSEVHECDDSSCSETSFKQPASSKTSSKARDKKRFRCIHCQYETRKNCDLVRHLRTHTGEKPFHCAYCPYRSALKHHLKSHERKHTGEKPFKCTHCSYSAHQNELLKKHMTKHTDEWAFKCPGSYHASQSHHLHRHTLNHTGEHLLKCVHCTFMIPLKKFRKIHLRTYASNKATYFSACCLEEEEEEI